VPADAQRARGHEDLAQEEEQRGAPHQAHRRRRDALGGAQMFNVVPLYLSIVKESDRAAVIDFQKKAAARSTRSPAPTRSSSRR
jgi:hypothetical protein